ncbi:MAG: VWA domain-containing protein [Spirochaetes bacterium]|nr:VWA domain-containing protein [Spirochaetota bacterium]
MKKSLSLLILPLIAVLAAANVLRAETAILPYRVENPSELLTAEQGAEYARLLSLAAVVAKRELVIASPGLLEGDMRSLGIDPASVITADDLSRLGRRGRYDYIILGTLTRVKKSYRSESVLFSTAERRVCGNFRVSARSLFKLAEAEMKEAFVQYRDRKAAREASTLDLAFVVDMSYAMSGDWGSVRRAVYGLSSRAVDTLGIDSRIYFIPYSKKVAAQSGFAVHNSLNQLRKKLAAVNPAGASGGFDRALEYAVKNIAWRQGAKKMIIVIAASGFPDSRVAAQYGVRAGKRGIAVHGISGGGMRDDRDTVLERLADASGGVNLGVAYHQRVYDKDGGAVELYMEGGRLFRSDLYVKSWRDGILASGRQRRNRRAGDRFEEIFLEKRGIAPDPHNMPDLYTRVTFNPVLNAGKLYNNIDAVLLRAAERSLRGGAGSAGPLGKVLITDGAISFWSPVADAGEMRFYRQKKGYPFPFPLGIVIRKNPADTYGISFIPTVRGITSDFVPALVKTTLSDVVQRKQYHMNEGLFFPPVWFIDARVEEVEQTGGMGDVRE